MVNWAAGSGGRTLWEVFGEIPDRRGAKGRQYPLRSVLALALKALQRSNFVLVPAQASLPDVRDAIKTVLFSVRQRENR